MKGLHMNAKRALSLLLTLMMLFASLPASSLSAGLFARPYRDADDPLAYEVTTSQSGRETTIKITANKTELYYGGLLIDDGTEKSVLLNAFLAVDCGDVNPNDLFSAANAAVGTNSTVIAFSISRNNGVQVPGTGFPLLIKNNTVSLSADGSPVSANIDHERLIITKTPGQAFSVADASPTTISVTLNNSGEADVSQLINAKDNFDNALELTAGTEADVCLVSTWIGYSVKLGITAPDGRIFDSFIYNGEPVDVEGAGSTFSYTTPAVLGGETVVCTFRRPVYYQASIEVEPGCEELGSAEFYEGEVPTLPEGGTTVFRFTVNHDENYNAVFTLTHGTDAPVDITNACELITEDEGAYYRYTVENIHGDCLITVAFVQKVYHTLTIGAYEHGTVWVNGEQVPIAGNTYSFEKGTEITITSVADEHYVADFEIPDPFLLEGDITITPVFVGEPCAVTVITVPEDRPSELTVTINGYDDVDGVYSIPYNTRINFTVVMMTGWSLSKAVLVTEDGEVAIEKDENGSYYADITGPASFRFEFQELPTAMVEWNGDTLYIDLSEDVMTERGLLSTLKGPQKIAAIRALLQQVITIDTNGVELNYQQLNVDLEEYNEDGWAFRIRAELDGGCFTGDADKVWFTVSFADAGVIDGDNNDFTLNNDPCKLQVVIDEQSVVIGERKVTIDVEYDAQKVLLEYSLDNGESFTLFRGHILEVAADSNVIFKFVGNLNNAYYVDEFKVNDVEVPLDGCWSSSDKAYRYAIDCIAPEYNVEVGAEEMSGVWNYNGHNQLNINTEIAFGITVTDNFNTEFTTEWTAENGDHESVLGENKIAMTDDTNVAFVDGKIEGAICFVVGADLPVNGSVRFGLVVTLGEMSYTFYSDYLPVNAATGNSSMVILEGLHGTNGYDYYYNTVTIKPNPDIPKNVIRYSAEGMGYQTYHESITFPRNGALTEGEFDVTVDVGYYGTLDLWADWDKNINIKIYTDTNKPVIESAQLVDKDGDGAVDAIQISAYDTASGIAAIKYSIDNGEVITVDSDHFSYVSTDSNKVRYYSATIDITLIGTYSIWAEDYCYNENDNDTLKSKHISDVSQIVIEDLTPPVLDVNVYYEPDGSDSIQVNVENGSIVPAAPVTVVITVADEGFDPAKGKGDYTFMLNGQPVALSFNAAEEGDALVAYYDISEDGHYDISVTVNDAQGNTTTKKFANTDGNEDDTLSFTLDTTAPEVLYGVVFEDGVSGVVAGSYNDSIIGGENYYYTVFNKSFRDAIISLKITDLTDIDLNNSYIIVLNSAGESWQVMLSGDAFIKDIEHGTYDLSFNNLYANGDYDEADTEAWFRITSLYIKDSANHVCEFESQPKFAFDVTAPAVSYSTSPAGELTNADSVTITYYVTDQHFDPAWEGGAFTAAGLPDDAQINWAYDSGLAAWVGVVSVDSEGVYSITASAADVVGNTENAVGLSFEIDRTAPNMTVSVTNTNHVNYNDDNTACDCFYEEDIVFTIRIKDDNYDPNGFAATVLMNGSVYDYGTLTWQDKPDNWHEAKITLNTNGKYTVSVASTDSAGNTRVVAPRPNSVSNQDCAVTFTRFSGELEPEIYVVRYNEDIGQYERVEPSQTYTDRPDHYNSEGELFIMVFVPGVYYGVWDPEKPGSTQINFTQPDKAAEDSDWVFDDNDNYMRVFPVVNDGTYGLQITIRDNRGKVATASDEFIIDRVVPTNVLIHYTENRWLSFLNDVTFGHFFQEYINVSIDAEDATSGVKSINYSVEIEGVAQPVTGTLENGGSFAITEEMLGRISAYATDYAGNVSDVLTDTGFIIDKVAPDVDVSYIQPNNVVGDKQYYNDPVVLTITVDEANYAFNVQNLALQEGEAPVGAAAVDMQLTKDGATFPFTNSEWINVEGDKWQSTVTIPASQDHSDDGEYQFMVTITDVVGNVGTHSSKIIVIDTTAPEFTVVFDNNDYNREVESGYFFDDVRNATITMVERNVKTEDISVITEGTLHDPNEKVEVTVTPWEPAGIDEQRCTIAYTKDAKYTLAITGADLAGNGAIVRYVDKDNNDVPCDQEFYIDVDVITDGNVDQRITSRISVSGEDTESWIEKVWTKFLENITFGLYSNKTVKVSLQGTDDFSGVNYIEYTTSNVALDFNSLNDGNRVWTRLDGGVYDCDVKTDFNLNPVESDRRIIVYMRAVDMAGNITYAASNGMVIEDTNPIAPEINISAPEAPAHGIYNRNVTLSVSVVDPENEANGVVSSGLASVTYEIFVDGSTTARTSGTLYPQGNTDYTRTFDGTIPVDASVHNSNDVRVVVHASDHAGNSSDADIALSIDVTAPTISVSFDKSTNSEGFINQKRVAQITITERNFNPADVVIRPVGQSNSLPAVSGWQNSGSGDSATHSATLTFDRDGIYQFSVDYTDLAGNPAVGYTSERFTVDMTNPVIEVVYKDSGVINGSYFSAERTATVTITETNFNPANVKFTRTASLLGESIDLPKISEWQTKNGNEHSCTIVYDADGDYTFGVSCTDRAGNNMTWETATAYDKEFTVDLTAPVLRVIGIDDKSANNADVIGFELYIEDNNLDIESCVLTLVADEYVDGQFVQNEHELMLADDENNSDIYKHFTSGNLADDGMYYLHCEIVDKAGNIAEIVNVGKDESSAQNNTKTIFENGAFSDSAVFSVNRFGSTYTVDDATRALLNEYNSNINRIVIIETNVDEISDTDLRAARSGLSANQLDYDIEDISGEHEWHQYRYTVPGTNFELDGWYQVFVSSTDATGTESTNEIKKFAIEFGVDKTAPECYIIGVEDGETYPVDEKEVSLNINDLSVAKVEVMLDGELLESWDGYQDNYTFTIPGDSTSDHKLVVKVTDNAGNETVKEVSKFYVTTNLWVRYYTNTPLFASTVGGAALGIGALIFFITRKRRKDDKKSSKSGKTAKLAE